MIKKNIFIFCKEPEKIENYAEAIADTKRIWHCHHRKEITDMMPSETLKKLGLYYNVEPQDLIFLEPNVHHALHNVNRSAETRKKVSDRLKGRKFTEEQRKKISDVAKTRTGSKNANYGNRGADNPLFGTHQSYEHRKKIAASRKGKFWFNNGVKMTFCFECPEGYVKGMLKVNKGKQ